MLRRFAIGTVAIAAALIAQPSHAAGVVYHVGSAAYEDGRPGFDPDATSFCDGATSCVGGTRDGMACGTNADCPDVPDGVVSWDAGVVHVVGNGFSVIGQYDAQSNTYAPILLHILPGAVVKVAHTCTLGGDGSIVSCTPTTLGGGEIGVALEGTLQITGATITDIRDDTIGGDTNNDGSATTPVPSYGILFSGSGSDLLFENEIRYAREIGLLGSMLVEGNVFKQLGGLSAGYGQGNGIRPPVRGSIPDISSNSFEILPGGVGPGAVDVRGTAAIVFHNTFTGGGTAVRIGPAWEDPYYYKGAMPEGGTTFVYGNTIHTKQGIITDIQGDALLQQVRFHAQILNNTLVGPGGNDSVGLRAAVLSDTLVQQNSVEGYAYPLQLTGLLFPATAVTAALAELAVNDNTFSLSGAVAGPSQNLDAYWDTFGELVNAEHNWWGHYTGPKDTSNADGLINERGLGLTVTNGIDYKPFLGVDESGDVDAITIAASSDPPAPLALDEENVAVTVAVDYDLQTAASGTVKVYLRNALGEILNPPFTSVAVTSSGGHVDVGPIQIAELPEYSSAVMVEAELVPDPPGSDTTRSNTASLPILKPTRRFRLECVSDAEKAGECPTLELLPHGHYLEYTSVRTSFVYTLSSSNVDVDVNVSVRRKGSGELLMPAATISFSGGPGFQVKHVEDFNINLPLSTDDRDLVIVYVARDDQGVEVGSGVRRIPILDRANDVVLTSVSALDSSDIPRGRPGHMLIGEVPDLSLDASYRIGTKNAAGWQVVAEGRAVDEAGSTLQSYAYSTPVAQSLATGAGEVKGFHPSSMMSVPLPAATKRFVVTARLEAAPSQLAVATASVSIPVVDAANVVSKAVAAGASVKTFHPIPAKMTIETNSVDGLVVMQQVLSPLFEDSPFGEPEELQPLQLRTASTRIARTTTAAKLIPLNRHFAVYDSLTDAGLSATVTFTYDPAEDFPDEAGFDADTLVVAVLNPLSGRLEALPSTHDAGQHTVTADYDGFFGRWTIASDTTAPAADCADPTADGKTTAADALFALRASVGSAVCAPCICDVNTNGSVTSSDALQILRFAVGQIGQPICDACA